MRSHVAFLRGINVGGKSILPMKRLAPIAESIGVSSVKTHLQSGNLLFSASDMRIGEIQARLEEEIDTAFGFRPAVIVRTREEIERVVEANPFAGNEVNGSRLITVFLRSVPSPLQVGALEPERFPDVSFAVLGQELHILYGEGMGSSKFIPAFYERRLGTVCTARNWNTVTKVLALLRE